MPKGVYTRPPRKPFSPTVVAVYCFDCDAELMRAPSHIKYWTGYCNPCSRRQRQGVPVPQEVREKISLSRKGKLVGENHWNWQGGKTDPKEVERTKFKRLVQKRILKRDNYTCQVCDQYGGYLQVDHIKSWSDYPELRFEESNCRTLCMACHYYVTFKRKLPKGVIWGHNFSRRIAS